MAGIRSFTLPPRDTLQFFKKLLLTYAQLKAANAKAHLRRCRSSNIRHLPSIFLAGFSQ